MDNQKQIPSSVPPTVTGSEESDFKGYTLEDIRYQRALIALKKEFCKEKLLHGFKKVKSSNPFTGNNKSLPSRMTGIAGKLISGMNFVDYALLGMSAFSTGKKIFRFFRRK